MEETRKIAAQLPPGRTRETVIGLAVFAVGFGSGIWLLPEKFTTWMQLVPSGACFFLCLVGLTFVDRALIPSLLKDVSGAVLPWKRSK